jgi:hypothetical protein
MTAVSRAPGQTPSPGLRRVLDAFLAIRPQPLTMRTAAEKEVPGAMPEPLETENGAPTSPAVRRPTGA